MNTFGHILRLTTFGESHGPAIGGVLDGFPPGISIDLNRINRDVAARRPGTDLTSPRKESDNIEFLSGLSHENITLGSPIAFICRNTDTREDHYESLRDVLRPNHADYTYKAKYGLREWRGGGRSSARETLARVVAGALVSHILDLYNIKIESALTGAGNVWQEDPFRQAIDGEKNPKIFLSDYTKQKIIDNISAARSNGNSIGGEVCVIITNMPTGLGAPIYAKLQADLAAAMLGINAVKGFEYGTGMSSARACGTETADSFRCETITTKLSGTDQPGPIPEMHTATNHSGGIQGGISNGMPIYFRVAFKPTPSIATAVNTCDTSGKEITLKVEGRHDPCVAVRGKAVVEAMAALTIADHILLSRTL